MRRLAALLVLTLAALMPSEAHLSKVYHQDVSLLELVNQTSWALVVRLDTPPTRVVTVPYSLTSRDGAPMESIYGVPVVRVIIEEVLRAEDETPSVGAALELYEPETLTMFELTLRYEATGSTKSPIFDRYEGVNLFAPQPADARFVVFVRPPAAMEPQDGPYAAAWRSMAQATRGMSPFVTRGAALPASRRDEVVAMLPPARATPQLVPPPKPVAP